MSERLHNQSSEQLNETALEEAAEKNRERIESDREKAAEKSHEHDEAAARHEALEKAASIEKTHDEEKAIKAEKRRDMPKQPRDLKASFTRSMKQVRSEMPASSRTFSKVIHAKAIEKPAEAIGSTLARPNALLSGAVVALVLTTAVYTWARYVGYPLSGFESIGAFIVGWLIGIIFDFTRIMVTGKR